MLSPTRRSERLLAAVSWSIPGAEILNFLVFCIKAPRLGDSQRYGLYDGSTSWTLSIYAVLQIATAFGCGPRNAGCL